MSPYVVPDHLLERNFRTTLTPTFWASLTIIPFDSLGPPQSKLVASDEDGVQHNRFVFEDGNVTFLVGPRVVRIDIDVY